VRQVQPDRRSPADQCSALASLPGWGAACQERPDDRQAPESDRRAGRPWQVGHRLDRGGADGAAPFPARTRRDYCRAAGCRDDGNLERREGLQ
ncbi:MAG TPA: hypothetical protein VFB61_05145, partial [Gemmatimonadales bacterium]|nr:hypothetical protein [Gemmatimonadales bacterium]